MANHKSSEKRARASLRKRERNRTYLSAVRTAVKSFKAAVATGSKEESLSELLQSAQSMLAKAAAKGMLHRNNAARRIARLAHMMKTPATAVAKPAKAASKKNLKPAAAKAAKAAKTAKAKSSSAPAKKVAKKKK